MSDYSDAVVNLNPVHRYAFTSDYNDSIGTTNGTNTNCTITTSIKLCEGVTASLETNATGDKVMLDDSLDIEGNDTYETCYAGWFMTDSIQNPPKSVVYCGGGSHTISIIMGWGNRLMAQFVTGTDVNLIFSDISLEVNRAYHLCIIYSGRSNNNRVRFFIDGVEQLRGLPDDLKSVSSYISSRDNFYFGMPAGYNIGGAEILINTTVKGYYNEWFLWNGSDSWLTNTEVREVLFEKGALPEITIPSDTQANMQSYIDTNINNNEYSDSPLTLRIEEVTGDGDLYLVLDNVIFNDKASIHIQYMGSGTLTLLNKGTSNASISSTPNGGTVIFQKEVTVSITAKDITTDNLLTGFAVYVADTSNNEIHKEVLDASTSVCSFSYTYEQDTQIKGYVRKASGGTYYKTAKFNGVITNTGFSTTIYMIRDM